jgi:peptide/nickel transport system substrate-binding protein
MRKRAVLTMLVLATVCTLIAGCGTPAAAPTAAPQTPEVIILTPTPLPEPTAVTGPPRGGTLRIGAAADLYLVDPHKVAGEIREFAALAEGLTALTPSGEIVPGLAESWDVSDDGTVYTFNLRRNVKFHNGEPLTADEVKWSLERVMDPATEAVRFGDMEPIESVEAVDEYTVRITLDSPYAPFLGLLPDTFIVHPDSTQEEGTITHPIGTGPFEFVEWIPDQHLKWTRFADYWQPDIPYLDDMIQYPLVEEAARFAALQTGEVDIIYQYPRAQVAQAALADEYDIAYNQASRWWCVIFNQIDLPEPLQDARVRRAIALALDKEEINNLYELGLGVVNNQWYAPGEFWYDESFEDVYREAQLDEARNLLADAGYPDGFEVTMIAPNVFDIDRLVTIIADQIGRIGIKGIVEISDWSSYEARLVAGENWGISGMGYSPKSDPVIYWNTLRVGPQAAYMGGGVEDPDLMAILDAAELETDQAARKALYHDAYKLLEEENYVIFVVSDFVIWGHGANVQNWQLGNSFYHLQGGGLSHVWLEE